MTEHLSDAELYAVVLEDTASDDARRHLAACPECSTLLRETERVLGALDAMPAAVAAPATLWARVQDRIRGQPDTGRDAHPTSAAADGGTGTVPAGWPPALGARAREAAGLASPPRAAPRPTPLKWLPRAAAGVALFLAGALFQSARTSGALPEAAPEPASEGATAADGPGRTRAADIQEAGTAYVTAIARLAAEAPMLPPEEVSSAREVAYAAMFGATHELNSLATADDAAAQLHDRARRAWLRAGEGGE